MIKAVVFDIVGVLAYQSRWGIFSEFNKTNLLMYMISNHRWPTSIKPRFFDVLAKIGGKQRPEPGSGCSYGEGTELPQIICDWLSGTLTANEVIAKINRTLASPEGASFVTGPREQRVIQDLAQVTFNPNLIAQYTFPLAEGEKLVIDCSRAGYDLFVLSNYAQDAFEALHRKPEFNRLFNYFPPEQLIISGRVGTIKPYHSIFELFLNRSRLAPEECVFIDNQLENVLAAQTLGFNAIFLDQGDFINHGDFAMVRSKLAQFGMRI